VLLNNAHRDEVHKFDVAEHVMLGDGVSHVSIGSAAVPLGGVDRLLLLVMVIGMFGR
jgi:hypothetical protein